jgi:hypothetical protein
VVECEYRPPGHAQAAKYGHSHWVREDCALRVISKPAAAG